MNSILYQKELSIWNFHIIIIIEGFVLQPRDYLDNLTKLKSQGSKTGSGHIARHLLTRLEVIF